MGQICCIFECKSENLLFCSKWGCKELSHASTEDVKNSERGVKRGVLTAGHTRITPPDCNSKSINNCCCIIINKSKQKKKLPFQITCYHFLFLFYILQRLQFGIKPSPDWGPALNENRITAGYPINPNQDDVDDHWNEKLSNEEKLKEKTDYVALESKNGEAHHGNGTNGISAGIPV